MQDEEDQDQMVLLVRVSLCVSGSVKNKLLESHILGLLDGFPSLVGQSLFKGFFVSAFGDSQFLCTAELCYV